ncbi:hypothetical protein MNV_1930001 [Candidatus Methanoperedens nitroreducens]|uniref:Uncharacterized protein n=1 Tax=Candidatus Methanoperedens nitratireducens TaxID=1392998 RepID=A0A284VMW9_9EURY|nr:hypothetical protein MNV_1930001 [Candidatus Methanoperedens nitroreducens]
MNTFKFHIQGLLSTKNKTYLNSGDISIREGITENLGVFQ